MTTEVMTQTEEQKNFDNQIAPIENQFKAITIKDDADFQSVDSCVKMIKKLQKDADTIFDPTIKKYYGPYVFWRDTKKAITTRLEALESIGKKAMIAFSEKRQRDREEAQRKANEEAAAIAAREAQKLEKKAEKAEAKGDTGKAEELREKAQNVHVPAAPVEIETPEAKGTSISYNWSAECVDLLALAKQVAEGKASLNLIQPNGPALNKFAQATKGTFPIEGVKFIKTPRMNMKTD